MNYQLGLIPIDPTERHDKEDISCSIPGAHSVDDGFLEVMLTSAVAELLDDMIRAPNLCICKIYSHLNKPNTGNENLECPNSIGNTSPNQQH